MTKSMRSRVARFVIISFQRAAVAPLSHGNMFNNYFISTEELALMSSQATHQHSCPQPSMNGVHDKLISLWPRSWN